MVSLCKLCWKNLLLSILKTSLLAPENNQLYLAVDSCTNKDKTNLPSENNFKTPAIISDMEMKVEKLMSPQSQCMTLTGH